MLKRWTLPSLLSTLQNDALPSSSPLLLDFASGGGFPFYPPEVLMNIVYKSLDTKRMGKRIGGLCTLDPRSPVRPRFLPSSPRCRRWRRLTAWCRRWLKIPYVVYFTTKGSCTGLEPCVLSIRAPLRVLASSPLHLDVGGGGGLQSNKGGDYRYHM